MPDGVDAGDRDVGADAVDDQQAEGEQDAPLQVLGLAEYTEVEVGRDLFGCGCHGRPSCAADAPPAWGPGARRHDRLPSSRPPGAAASASVYSAAAASSAPSADEDGDRAAGRLHRLDRRLRGAGDGEAIARGHLALRQQPDAVELAPGGRCRPRAAPPRRSAAPRRAAGSRGLLQRDEVERREDLARSA